MADLFGDEPPIERHRITGVPLNIIAKKRRALTFQEAVTAHLLRFQGVTFTDTVHKLGTNANRVGEVLRGEKHRNARAEAIRLLTAT